MMINDTYQPYFDKKLKLWVIRLSETIAETTVDEAKYKANQKIEAYRTAWGFDTTTAQLRDELKNKIILQQVVIAKQQKEIEKLKARILDCVNTGDCEDHKYCAACNIMKLAQELKDGK